MTACVADERDTVPHEAGGAERLERLRASMRAVATRKIGVTLLDVRAAVKAECERMEREVAAMRKWLERTDPERQEQDR